MNMTMRTARPFLQSRDVTLCRVEPYTDGRDRFAVNLQGAKRALARFTDDIDEAVIWGLKMASARDAANVPTKRTYS